MAILTDSGRAAAAAAINAQPLHMAWGSGDPLWDDTPFPEPADATELVNEVGRRRVTQAMFCLPDEQGGLIVPTGRFTASSVPTKYLYLRFAFDFTDAEASTIREIAIFSGTTAVPGVPEGQDYLVPSDIADPGLMVVLERIPALVRSASVRQQFEFVIQF